MTPSLLTRFVLKPGVLNASVAAGLRAVKCDRPEVVGYLLEDIRAGRAKVAHIEREGVRVGFVVFEATADHELFIHAAFGRDDRRNLVDELVGDGSGLLETLARACECTVIRFHTQRAGLVSRALERGFHVSEIVMRKAVK